MIYQAEKALVLDGVHALTGVGTLMIMCMEEQTVEDVEVQYFLEVLEWYRYQDDVSNNISFWKYFQGNFYKF